MMKAMPMEPKKYDKYEIESAVDSLLRAEEIKKDEGLMKHVRKQAGKKVAALQGFAEVVKKPGKKPIRSIDDMRAAGQKLNKA
jgi:hypothetical protein